MKLNRTSLFTIISAIALSIVLVIQVNWIIQAAQQKEEIFIEKSKIVQARTTEAIASDTVLSSQIANGTYEKRKIDSLIVHFSKYYNFNEPFRFEIIVQSPTNPLLSKIDTSTNQQACYDNSIDMQAQKNGWKLALTFPQKRKFILSEMKLPFFSSIILIIVVIILFWRTVSSLSKEKKISEHTTEFLNNMTHEFKTPLTNIALAGKMMIKDATFKQDEKIKHYSEIILEENEKLRLQVEQVLSMTALERGEIPLQKTELDFHQLIKEALKSMSIQIENKEGILNLNLDALHFVVMGDKTHLTNAVSNLIDNAIKYSNGKPDLTIQTLNMDKNLVLTVTDKGIGIDKEYQKKVYEKYFRVPTGDVHDVRGFGLGLAYVKKIIELHGGTIDLESIKAKGTKITITLPHD